MAILVLWQMVHFNIIYSSLENDNIRKFFSSLAYLNFNECKKLLQVNSGISGSVYDQFAQEGHPPKDIVTKQFVGLLQELAEFEMRYYQFSYFEEKDQMSNCYQKFQEVRIQFNEYQLNKTTQPMVNDQHNFMTHLIQIISEMECYIRMKIVMMQTYRYEIYEYKCKDEARLMPSIKEIQNKLDKGPTSLNINVDISLSKGSNKSLQKYQQPPLSQSYSYKMPIQKYEWSKEMKKLKDHFILELNTIEQLFKSKQAALRQDHLTALLATNNTKEFLRQRNQEFYDKYLKDQHNQYNNLWKWIMNMQFVIVSRNRVLLNLFISNQEKYVKSMADASQEISQGRVEQVMIQKIIAICEKELLPQRVDIIMKIDTAKQMLKFNMEYLQDQMLSDEQIEKNIIKYKDFQQYFVLYSYTSQNFKEPFSYRLFCDKYDDFVKDHKYREFDLRKIFFKFSVDNKVKYHLGMFDEAHFLLITSLIDPKIKQKDIDKMNESRMNLLKSLGMDRYYRGMSQWKNVHTCFS